MILLVLMVVFNNCGQPGEIRFNKNVIGQPSTSNPDDNSGTGGVTPDPQDPVAPRPPVTNPPVIEPPEVQPPTGNEPQYTKVEKVIALAEAKNADILFVIDNSISMADEQSNMSERFPLFIRNLSSINWRAGIITTDIDAPSEAFSDGKLQIFSNGEIYIDSKIPLLDAEKMFGETIQRKEEGSSYEQGIFATYRFLERDRARKLPFMRKDASLNVVFVSDADETPYNLNGKPYYQKKNKPDELVKYLKANWPLKKFQFHAIVVNDRDEDCLNQSGNESYGIQYEKLATQTLGVKGSVCAKDYGSQLLFLSEKIKELVNTIDLDCEPAYDQMAKRYLFDVKYDGLDRIEVDKIVGKKVFFKAGLPVGVVKLEYSCLKNLSN